MSLATRCTDCGTIFRVVQDQLKVSHGWVRCGKCRGVFNALEGLFDLERDTPPDWSAVGLAEPTQNTQQVPGFAEGPADERESDPFLVDRIDAQIFGQRRSDAAATPSVQMEARDQRDFADAQFEPDFSQPDSRPDFSGPQGNENKASADGSHGPAATLDFVRSAQTEAKWQDPLARLALSLVVMLLTSGLALQVAHHFRDTIAAHWPQANAGLIHWCAVAHCRIEAPRRIDDISVESTSLTRVATQDAFRLSVTLRNRASIPLAVPMVDLSLTDHTGRLVARRALGREDFQSAPAVMAAGAESILQLVLSTGSQLVAGYTVEVFYP